MRDVRYGPARRWVAAGVAATTSMVVPAIPAAAVQQTSWSLRPAVTRVEPHSRPRASLSPRAELTGAAFAQQAELTAADGATSDRFGDAFDGTSISGNLAAVGAPNHEDGSNEQEGAVYVFSDASGSWQQAAELIASDPDDQGDDRCAQASDRRPCGYPGRIEHHATVDRGHERRR